jgi:hypothetical protein
VYNTDLLNYLGLRIAQDYFVEIELNKRNVNNVRVFHFRQSVGFVLCKKTAWYWTVTYFDKSN